ncbi:MAG: hypothetical protein AAFR52_01510 [Pseudomonadota bacterium]
MNRMAVALMVPMLAIVLTALALMNPVRPMPSVFLPEDCRRVELVDQRLRVLQGIEDIVLLSSGEMIFTAHDRRYKETPGRGVFRTTLQDMAEIEGGVIAQPIPGVARAVENLFPHGLAIDRAATRLAFVNRPAEGEAEVVWGDIGPQGFLTAGRWSGGGSCRANDVMFRGADLVVTIDRANCSFSFDDAMPGAATGSIMRVSNRGATPLLEGLAFANGIIDHGGQVWVAETRANRIRNVQSDAVIELPGGPDNISPGPLGRMIVALHPDLIDYWLYTLGWSESAGTRILAFDPRRENEEPTFLFDDPLGKTFSGGSVGAMALGTLVIGSAYETGVLMCLPSQSRPEGQAG